MGNQAEDIKLTFPIVACITDFGLTDSYVSEVYGVMLSKCPDIRIVDITHLIPPGDIQSGSYVLGRAVKSFPIGTIFLAVVDPGVGSDRQAVIVKNGNYCFIAPDNGLLSRAIDWNRQIKVRSIAFSDGGSIRQSKTFHGRDLMAPVAGMLASGTPFDTIGILSQFIDTFEPDLPIQTENGWEGTVIYIDRFGNLITNLPNELDGTFVLNSENQLSRVGYYADKSTHELFCIDGSDGFLEIAANKQRADTLSGLSIGDKVLLQTN